MTNPSNHLPEPFCSPEAFEWRPMARLIPLPQFASGVGAGLVSHLGGFKLCHNSDILF